MLTLLRYLRDALFPPQCLVCETKLDPRVRFSAVCEPCFAKIPVRSGFTCSVCGARQPSLVNECHKNTLLLAAATEYANHEAQTLIRALKYERAHAAAKPLAALLTRFIETHPVLARGPIVLVPIPLHTAKERARGYNQSMMIAHDLAKLFLASPVSPLASRGGPIFTLAPHALRRTRNTPSQTTLLSHAERARNIKDAFEIRDACMIQGAVVFLVDDVSTSGATIREAARILKSAGARSVLGLVVAKA